MESKFLSLILKIFLSVAALLKSIMVDAQTFDGVTYVPPSPDAAALLEYASIPVNLYNGLPLINVPLGVLKGKNSSLPMSISYHASGIKIQDVSSSVGLGWSLNAGGAITRVVRGLPDEHDNGYINVDFETVSNQFLGLTSGTVDAEPDIFYFNFMGHSGKLILDQDGIPMQLPEQNYTIIPPNFLSSDPKWEIQDLSGIRYIFGKTSASRETTTAKLKHETSSQARTYISTWYLAEVIYPIGGEYIKFLYTSAVSNLQYENYRQIEGLQQPGQALAAPCATGTIQYPFSVFDQVTEITVNSPKSLSMATMYRTISATESKLGEAVFNYNNRLDQVNARRLTSITLKNMQNTQVKQIKLFNDSYFTSPGCSDASLCKRLKLDSIKEVASNGFSILIGKFQYYDEELLPARNSIESDHWGYYNNNAHSSALPTVTDSYGNTYNGADKSPNLNRTKANTLIRITNGAGGYQHFSYALNEYWKIDTSVPAGGVNESTGGLRILSIAEGDGTGGEIIRTYTYRKISNVSQSSGNIYRQSRYHFERKIFDACNYTPPGSYPSPHTYGNSIVVRYSSSLVDQFDIGGLHVGYSDVQINYGNGSKEQLFFHDFVSRPDDQATLSVPPDVNHEDFSNPDGPPFIPRGDRSYERGLLREHIFFGSDGLKKKRFYNEYDFYVASSREIPACKNMLLWQMRYSPGSAQVMYTKKGVYKYYHRGVRLLSAIEEIFDQTDESRKTTKHSSYGYNSRFSSLVANCYTHLNDGSVLRETIKYPRDYFYFGSPAPSSSEIVTGLYLLCSKGIYNQPIEMIFSLKGPGESDTDYEATSCDLLTFKENSLSGNPVLAARYKLPVEDPILDYSGGLVYNGEFLLNPGLKSLPDYNLRKMEDYYSYDTYDNPTQTIGLDGEVSYEWNSDYKFTEVTAITRQAGGQQHRVEYEYKPMVGLVSVTDVNGSITTYEYDVLNRLKLVKQDGEILKRYSYHLKTQKGLTASLSSSSNKTVGVPITYTVEYEGLEESSQFVWNFGDGTSATTAQPSTFHTYSSSGKRQVSVSISNQQYGTASASVSVDVAEIAICADGPQTKLDCGNLQPVAGACTTASSITNESPTLLKVSSTSGGCANFTYQWEYFGSNGWQFLGSGVTCQPPSGFTNRILGSYSVRCIATDSCGNTYISEITLHVVHAYC